MTVKPFIKWAGGKTQLLPQIRKKYPLGLGEEINKYCEPFVGGGAVLFDALSKYRFDEVLINDINAELINVYLQIQMNVDELIFTLYAIQEKYLSLNDKKRKEYYYKKREEFNSLKIDKNKKINLKKATLFIFLNKTCFNGLFRVNKQGFFNVPVGAYKNSLICNKENLKNISKLLQKVVIKCGDFKDCARFIDKNTFAYIDPPYRPLSKTASFTSYARTEFNDKEQLALGEFVNEITLKGAKVIISNSDPKNINKNDCFFDRLYRKYNINRILAKRMINCDSKNRGNINELLILNYY